MGTWGLIDIVCRDVEIEKCYGILCFASCSHLVYHHYLHILKRIGKHLIRERSYGNEKYGNVNGVNTWLVRIGGVIEFDKLA